jgi:hypothetical protein
MSFGPRFHLAIAKLRARFFGRSIRPEMSQDDQER